MTNLQGDVVAIIDADGNAKVQYTYDAWGKILSISGPMADTLGAVNPLTYRGYVYDTETDLYYLESRYYDSAVERFLNHDVVFDTDAGLHGHNLFTYCANNPSNRIDISGADSEKIEDVDIADPEQDTFGAGGLGNILAPVPQTQGFLVRLGKALIKELFDALDIMLQSFNDGMGGMSGNFRSTPSCFIAGTMVCTEQGTLEIEKIQVGDFVWAWDEITGDIALKEVVETYVHQTKELIHVFVNGEEIITTPTHPFYSPVKGWTEAVHLRAGDILVLVNGEYVVVEKVQHEILETPVTVYNFNVEDYHTYFVTSDGVLVHNLCTNNAVAMYTNDALDMAEDYLGPNYKEISPGSGRYVSGNKQVRIGITDITGAHGGGPHINFDWIAPNEYETFHVYLLDP